MYSVFAALVLLAAGNPSTDIPNIAVDGNGTVSTAPDVATISYTVWGEGQTSDAAASALVARTLKIEAALRSLDPSLELHDSDLKVLAVRGASCKDGSEDDNGNRQVQLSAGPCAIIGYRASKDAIVKTLRVTDAGTMVGLASRQGGLRAELDSFGLRDARDAQQRALSAAFADALVKAQALAVAGHVHVGRLLSATTESDRAKEIVVTGSLRQSNAVEYSPVRITLAPSPVRTEAQVHVAYAIEP